MKLNSPVVESCFSVGLILEPREVWIVTSSLLTPRQTNWPKRALTSMCMEVTYKCRLLGLSLLLALADFPTCTSHASVTATSLSFLEVFGLPTLFSLNNHAN